MISLIFILILLGLLAYCVSLIPMPAPFPIIVRVLFILAAIYVVLSAFGMVSGLPHLK